MLYEICYTRPMLSYLLVACGILLLTSLKKPVITARKSSYIYVERGDNLIRIATYLGIDPDELARFNGLHPPYKLREGQVLRYPATSYPIIQEPDLTVRPIRLVHPKPLVTRETTPLPESISVSSAEEKMAWPFPGIRMEELRKAAKRPWLRGYTSFEPIATLPVCAPFKGVVKATVGAKGRKVLMLRSLGGKMSLTFGQVRGILPDGSTVKRGQEIALWSGQALLVEVRVDGKVCDPLKFFEENCD